MEESYLEEIDTSGLEGFVSCNENIGIFPQNTQRIFNVGHRKLQMPNEIIIIVEIVIQKSYAQWQGQGDDQQEKRVFSEPLHSVCLPIRYVE